MKFGILNTLTIIFVIAKLLEVIHWSWWLVLLPTMISFGLTVLLILFGIFCAYKLSK